MTFDLTREPWLPVVGADGLERDVSLIELFRDAGSLRRLSIAFAPERVAVTRILVAVLQSANRGPRNHVERAKWIEDPKPRQAAVLDYLETWKHRFDLFDLERPFMQRAVDPATAAASVAVLVLDWAAGNNVTLFDHHVDAKPPAITVAEAARAVLTTLLYQPGGGVSKPFNRTDSPGSKGLMVLVEGESLWETLVANTPRIDRDDDFGGGIPSWERSDAQDREATPLGTMPEGWLDRATWQSRAIQLIRDADGLVRTCRIHQHLKLGDGAIGDPFVPLKKDPKDGELKIVRMTPGRRLWRSADVVLRGLSDRDRGSMRRTVVAEALDTFERLDRSRHPQLFISGLQIDQAKVGDAQSARLPVSRELLEDEDRLRLVTRAVAQAQSGATAVGYGIGLYMDSLGLERDNKRYDQWRQPYWAQLGSRFPVFVDAVASADATPQHVDPAPEAWTREVVAAAAAALDRFLGTSTRSFGHDRAVARARQRFERAIEEDELLTIHHPTPELA